MMQTCPMTTLRTHDQGTLYAPVMVGSRYQLQTAQGHVLVGYRGNPYNFASPESARMWLQSNLLKLSVGIDTSDAHLMRLVTLQGKIGQPYLQDEIDNIISRNAGDWNVSQPVEYMRGAPGKDGKDGVDGLPGVAGVPGIKGDKGDAGAQGLPGADGSPGVMGLKGDKGDAGAQGLQGELGLPGAQGLKGDKGDAGAGIVGIIDSVHAFSPRYIYPQITHAVASSAFAAGSVMTLRPIVVDEQMQLIGLGFNVGTAAAGVTARVGIYANKRIGGVDSPDALLSQSAQIDLSTAGVKEHAVSLTLQPKTVYWLAYQSSANASVTVISAMAGLKINSNMPNATYLTHATLVNTYANGLPEVAGSIAWSAAGAYPAIGLKVN